jgi:hypothetical protein
MARVILYMADDDVVQRNDHRSTPEDHAAADGGDPAETRGGGKAHAGPEAEEISLDARGPALRKPLPD